MAASGKQDVKVKLQNKTHSAISDLIALEKSVLKNSKSKDVSWSITLLIYHNQLISGFM